MMRSVFVALLVLMAQANSASADESRWLKAESPQFVVYGEVGEARLVSAVRDLEALDGLLRRMTQTTAPPSPIRLEVYLLGDRRRLNIVWPGLPVTTAGFYTARPDMIAAFADYDNDAGSRAGSRTAQRSDGLGKYVLYHEYAHHFMYQYFANAYPGWYIEGFAEYVANTRFVDGRIEVGRVPGIRADWLLEGKWMDIERLLKGRDSTFTADDVSQFYAQSWLTVHYLVNTAPRMQGFLKYVAALRTGADPIAAFQPAFGVTPQEFDAELRRYRRAQLAAFALNRPAAVEQLPVTVTPMPKAADDLLLLDARVRTGRGDGVMDEIRTVAARFPDDAYALRTLALAEVEAGDPVRAVTIADAVLQKTPDDAHALYLKGLALMKQARSPGADRPALVLAARPLFARANRLAPDDPDILYNYAQTTMGFPGVSQENSLNVLLLAQQLAPQVDVYRMASAAALMDTGRFNEAVALLNPLAFEPHGGKNAEIAREMLEAARNRRPYAPAGGAPPAQ